MIYPNAIYRRPPLVPPKLPPRRSVREIRISILQRNPSIRGNQLRIENCEHGKVLVFINERTITSRK